MLYTATNPPAHLRHEEFVRRLREERAISLAEASAANDAPAQPSVSPKLSRHLFRSPFEVAGVHRYSMPEVEHVFGTKSSDSVFWSIFSTFHTLLPHEVEEAAPDESIADFVGQGARTRD